MDFVVIFVVLLVVVWFVSGPLRSRQVDEVTESAERADLEAARDAKYREIRDAELDYRTGKLSEGDWRGVERSLRGGGRGVPRARAGPGEAMVVLRALDDLPTSAADERS